MPSAREIELRMHRCCFSFNQYEQLGIDYNEANELIDAAVRRAIDRGYVTFLCGMNRGADLWAAQVVLRMKGIYLDKNINLVSVLPFPGYGEDYTGQWLEQFQFLTQWGQAEYTVSAENNGVSSIRDRNCWMVDRCTRIITDSALPGSLASKTLNYAKSRELDIDYINCTPGGF